MPLSGVINVNRYNDPEWRALHDDLYTYSIDKHVFATNHGQIYRKGWEWTQCIYGLQKLGMIKPYIKALGVGAGRESIIFWLSDHIDHVTATDLYGNDTWSSVNGAEASTEVLANPQKFCPRPIDLSKLNFENADGTKLPYADDKFDFCWSLSSIEHFGSHEASANAVKEMVRVTKPGGVICITTEYLILEEQTHPEYFNKSEIEKYIINATEAASLVDGMDWTLPPHEYLLDQVCVVGDGVHRRRRHVILNDGNVQWTSLIVFLRKLGQ